jgi:prepilin-type N-terminal cleavage/methylation domain-containing protein
MIETRNACCCVVATCHHEIIPPDPLVDACPSRQIASRSGRVRSNPEAGFTLVELLITIAILALMVVYGWSAVGDLFKLNGQVASQERQAEADAAARYMHDEISDMRMVFTRDQNNAPRLMFSGNEHDLGFVAVANGERDTGGMYWVHYRVDDQGNLVSERSLLRNEGIGPIQTVILLRKVQEISFRYWNALATSFAAAQLPRWDRTDQLPKGIEVNVTFADGTTRQWQPCIATTAAGR